MDTVKWDILYLKLILGYMAQLVKSTLGLPIGKHGKTIFRRNKRKIFTYEASGEPMKIKSEKAQNNRLGFGRLGKFCNFINKSKLIKLVWKKSRQPGTATNRQILKYNHISFKSSGISSGFNIIPESLFIHSPIVRLDEDKLIFSFTTRSTNKNKYDENYADFIPPYVFIALIHAKDPVNPESDQKSVNVMLEEYSEEGPFSRDEATNYSFDVPKKAFSFIKDYNTVLVFPAIIQIDEYNTPVKWSETGGIYVKGKKPPVKTREPEKPREKPGKSFRIEYM